MTPVGPVAAALAVLAPLLFVVSANPAGAATITVTTSDDVVAADGECSLREAIEASNTDSGVDTCAAGSGADVIELPAGTYTLGAELLIDGAGLTLRGAGSDSTHLVAGGAHRLISHEGGALVLEGLTLRDGTDTHGGAVSSPAADELHVVGSRFENNAAVGGAVLSLGGGAIYSEGPVTVESSNFTGNRSGTETSNLSGGAIRTSQAPVTITSSSFHDNTARNVGGAISVGSTVDPHPAISVDRSTFSSNSARIGGVIYNSFGTVTLQNSTVSGNETIDGTAPPAAAVQSRARLTLIHSTVVGNEGVGVSAAHGDGGMRLVGSIVADNTPEDCWSNAQNDSGGGNLIGSWQCISTGLQPGDQSEVDPLLGPLADNGGPTLTHQPLEASPAINGAPTAECPATDQRGEPRPQDGAGDGAAACDSGSVEVLGAAQLPEDPDNPANPGDPHETDPSNPGDQSPPSSNSVVGDGQTSPSAHLPSAPRVSPGSSAAVRPTFTG